MKFCHKQFALLLVPIVLFWLLPLVSPYLQPVALEPIGVEEMGLSERHYFIFPLAVALLAFVFFRRLSSVAIGLACIFPVMVFGSRYVFSYSFDSEYPGVVLARLHSDSTESKTLRLREQILRFSSPESRESIERHFQPIRTHKAARSRFPNAPAVVWGDGDKVKISMPDSESNRVIFARNVGRKVVRLHLIHRIPGFDISYEPLQQTGLFISRFIHSLELEARSRPFEQLEQLYIEMGEHRSGWKKHTHMGYPWWKLGNLYVEEAFASVSGNTWAKCAAGAYSKAAARLHPHAHPLLRASTFNNKAVSLLIGGGSQTKADKKAALVLLKKAAEIAKRKGRWGARKYVMLAIRQNQKALKDMKGRKKKKKKKKKHAKQKRSSS